ncbi:hypothetical protein KIL84_007622, partial [Mauremys mutica]
MAVGIALLLGLGSAAGAFLVSTDPSPVTGLLGSDLLLTCSFPAAPRGAGEGDGQLRVTWHFQGSRVAELDGIPISTRVGAILFSQQQGHAQASLLLPRVTPADQGPYRCSVRYAGQHGEGTVRVQVAALPRVEVPSPVVQRDEDSALVCCVRGFYPQHIAVSWLRDGQELNASFVSAARRGHRDGTFSLVTVYRLTPTERDLGALFSCRARHPLLNQSRQADFRIAFRGSRLQLVTDPSSRALLGSGALLKCQFDVGGPVDLSSLRVQWYLFEERIAQYDQGRGESQPGVSVLEQELELGDASLSLSSVTVSDEGPYKCVVGYGTEQLQGETTLRVLAAPRLSIPRRSAGTDTASSFPCHVWGFYPGDVTVTWLRDGRVLTDATHSAPQRNPDGTFNLTLTYTFTPTVSDSGSIFSCRVSHAALAQPLREEFPLDVTGADHTSTAIGATLGILVAGGAAAAIAIYCWRKRQEGRGPPYSVSEVLGPAQCLLGQEVTLSCAMEGKFPEDTAVTWERIHGEDRTVIGTDGDDGVRVRCSFHHKSRGIREQRESGEIQLWGSRLQLVTDPSSRALLGSGTLVKCRFDAGGPVDLSSLRVQWYLWEERIAQYDQGRGESQVRGSLSEQELENGNASLWLSSVTVSDMGLYKCVVGYRTEQLQGETTLRVLAAPRLSVPRKAGVLNAATSFPCHVWGFYPGDVTVTWLRDGQVLTDATRSAPERNPDGTFNLTLTYTFTPTASDSGSIFSCHVSHAALVQPLREEFPLAVTGADHTSAAIGATLGILVAGGAAAAIAIYCWRKRRE